MKVVPLVPGPAKPIATGTVPASSCLTAAALVIHLLMGCCWHHAHRVPADSGLVAAHEHSHDDGHPCSHDRGGSSDGCNGPHCVYVVGKPALRSLGVDQAMVAPLADPRAAPSPWTGPADVLPASVTGPPLRTHLLYQVLLL